MSRKQHNTKRRAPARTAIARTTCDFTPANSSIQATGRVDRIVQQLTGRSRSGVRGLFDHGCVYVNDSICTDSAAIVQSGDRVEVHHDPGQRYKEKPRAWSDPAFSVVHEDDHVLVVNKAAHVLTVPTGKKDAGTLVRVLQDYLQRTCRRDRGAPARAWVVHRLDRGVSGLLVFGKSEAVAQRLKDQFADRKPERVYVAIVAGEMNKPRGTFRSHLATDANLNRYSTKNIDSGELAITHYEIEAVLRGATVVRVRLETGRRNQIRVHFAEAGHPVLGDPRYPREHPGSATHPRWKARRLALHAASLGFRHPITGRSMRFEAPLPKEFGPFLSGKHNH